MKKILTLLALCATVLSAQAQMYSYTIQGTVVNVPDELTSLPIVIGYSTGNGMWDVITVDAASGAFSATVETYSTQGFMSVSWLDCNNAQGYDSLYYSTAFPLITTVINYCPDGVDPVDPGNGGNDGGFEIFDGDSVTILGTPEYNVVVVVSPPGADSTYSWSFGDGGTSDDDFPVYVYNSSGTYDLCLIVWGPNGDSSMYCQTFTIDDNGNVGGGIQTPYTLVVVSSFVVGVNEAASLGGISVFPNPVNETSRLSLNLTDAFAGQLQVLSIDGRLLRNQRLTLGAGKNQVDFATQDLESGMYMVRLVDAAGRSVSRTFVK